MLSARAPFEFHSFAGRSGRQDRHAGFRAVLRGLAPLLFSLAAIQTASANDHLTVLLDWFVNPNHAPLIVAEQIGAYAAEGLDVTLVPPADATMPPKLVAAGQGDIALTAEPQFLEQVSAGLPLIRIGVLIDKPLSTLVVLGGHGITKLADLRGKRIGYGAGGVEPAMVARMLQNAGLSIADVQMVQVGEQLTVALLTHQVDAVSVYRNFETIELPQQGQTPVGFDYEQNGVPNFDELIFVVKPGALPNSLLTRFLRATAKGTAHLLAHPEEDWTSFAKSHPELDNTLNHDSWFTTLPYFAKDSFALNPAQYERFAAFLLQAGIIKTRRPVGSLARVPN